MQKVTKVLKENATNIAFIGRPNVGKSSLFNRLLGELKRRAALVLREEMRGEERRENLIEVRLTAVK